MFGLCTTDHYSLPHPSANNGKRGHIIYTILYTHANLGACKEDGFLLFLPPHLGVKASSSISGYCEKQGLPQNVGRGGWCGFIQPSPLLPSGCFHIVRYQAAG